MVAIDAAELEDFVLSRAPGYLADLEAADEDLRSGQTRPAAEVFAELDA